MTRISLAWLPLAPLALVGSVALAEEAQHVTVPEGFAEPVLTSSCTGGVVYDDGLFEAGYSIGDGDPGDSTMVMRFNLPGGTSSLDQACLCFTRNASEPSSMPFEVVVYDNNGPSGAPGTYLGTVGVTAGSIPVFPNVAFYNVNLTSSGLVLPDTSVYVGARWRGGQTFLCGDRSTGTTQRVLYGSGNSGASWQGLSSLFPTTQPRALGIRVDPHTATAGCTPTSTGMCLNDNRFLVQAHFDTGELSGNAQVVKLTSDTGYLWYFNSSNVEVVVKILNACALNNRYWVFAGGLTNVETVITVTDTERGVVKTYTRPGGPAFQPIQDTSAFATCP